jgi:hypothetical protein
VRARVRSEMKETIWRRETGLTRTAPSSTSVPVTHTARLFCRMTIW